MPAVVLGLGGASGGASGWVVTLALAEGEELVAHIGVFAGAVEGRVDSAPKFGGAVEAIASWWWGVFVVA